MAKENLPNFIKTFWADDPTDYTDDDIEHLEPDSEVAVFLKYLFENGFATLTIQKNGTTIDTYNGSGDVTINISVPNITYGTAAPSGGNEGDIYMRYWLEE